MNYLDFVCKRITSGENWVTEGRFPIIGCKAGKVMGSYQELIVQIALAGRTEQRVHDVFIGNGDPVIQTEKTLSVRTGSIYAQSATETSKVAEQISDHFYNIFCWFNKKSTSNLTLVPNGPQQLINSESGTAIETADGQKVTDLFIGRKGRLFVQIDSWCVNELAACGSTYFKVKNPSIQMSQDANSITVFDGNKKSFEIIVNNKN